MENNNVLQMNNEVNQDTEQVILNELNSDEEQVALDVGGIVLHNRSIKIMTWNETDIRVKTALSLDEAMSFVNSVVKSCYAGEDQEYVPLAKDFAVRTATIDMYTNISLPDDVGEKYDFVYHTDIYDSVIAYIDMGQFYEINSAIEEGIKTINSANLSLINKKVDDVYFEMNKLLDNMGEMMNGISDSDIKTLMEYIMRNTPTENA